MNDGATGKVTGARLRVLPEECAMACGTPSGIVRRATARSMDA
jgi:hypothetical protein